MKSEYEHVYGVHPVLELLHAGGRRIETILLLAAKRQNRGIQQIVNLAARPNF